MSDIAHTPLFLGLISGTSADGIDAALVRFDSDSAHARPMLLAGQVLPWPPALREQLVALGQHAQALTLDAVGVLDAVSYTHLDVYKRQPHAPHALSACGWPPHWMA